MTSYHTQVIEYPSITTRNDKDLKPIRKFISNTHPTSTTSFLTATTLIYAIGAGITAAAGTRLALQLFIDMICTFFSIQLQNQRFRIVIYCHYLPVSGLGNLRACCLPWMW